MEHRVPFTGNTYEEFVNFITTAMPVDANVVLVACDNHKCKRSLDGGKYLIWYEGGIKGLWDKRSNVPCEVCGSKKTTYWACNSGEKYEL